jgi:hypothetical protein
MPTYRTHPHCYTAAELAAESVGSAYRRSRNLPPAGATHSVRFRAAVFGRPGAAPVRTQTRPARPGVRHGPDSPAVHRPSDGGKPRRRGPPFRPVFGTLVPLAMPLSLLPHLGICEPSLTSNVAHADSRPSTRSAHWTGWLGPAEFDSRRDRSDRLTNSHCPPERPPHQSRSLGWVAGLRDTQHYGSIEDQPGQRARP